MILVVHAEGSVIVYRLATASAHASPFPHFPSRTICCHSSVAAMYAASNAALFVAAIAFSLASWPEERRYPFTGLPTIVSGFQSLASLASLAIRHREQGRRRLPPLHACHAESEASLSNVLDACLTPGAATRQPCLTGGHAVCNLQQAVMQ